MAQLLLAATEPPVRLIEVAPPVGENVPPQLLVLLGVVATCRPVGNASVTPRPVRVTVLPVGLVMVMVSVVLKPVPTAIELAANDLVIVGGISTARVAVAVPPVPPLLELTLPVVLVLTPAVVLVTLPVMVQLPLVGIEAPLMLTALLPTPPPVNVAPEQVVVAAVEKVIPLGSVSLTATPVRATVLAVGFVIVMVIVDVPVLTAMLAEPNDLVMVGADMTVSVAEAVVPVLVGLVELTVPVVLTLLPAVLAVTSTFTSQLPPIAMLPLARLIVPEPAVAVNVPPQVLLVFGTLATTTPLGNVSLTATPVRATVLAAGLVMVRVRVDVPPTRMPVGPNALTMVGGATAVNAAEAVVPVPPFVELTAPVVLV